MSMIEDFFLRMAICCHNDCMVCVDGRMDGWMDGMKALQYTRCGY